MPKPGTPHMNSTSRLEPIAQPLGAFYARNGLTLPPMEQVHPQDVPQPYRTLLVHERDMTSTLEKFHGGPVTLTVLGREREGDIYSREVFLKLEQGGKPVEFGAIRINLALFEEGARERILAEIYPLGRILRDYNVEYTSNPQAFLKIASDHMINDVLKLEGAHVLYGRRNTLLDTAGRCLADIVEIVPPEPKR